MSFQSFKETTYAYLLKISMIHNKSQNPNIYLLIAYPQDQHPGCNLTFSSSAMKIFVTELSFRNLMLGK